MMKTLVHCRRPAMATLFEVWLAGDDSEHLAAVGEAALDEVERVEKLLSRFDPSAELARVNRHAFQQDVLVSPELFAVAADCLRRWEQTDGYFDVCAGGRSRLPEAMRLDPARRTIRFTRPGVLLDLGGYGKGYALDAAAGVLDAFGARNALLHGGTSSVLARGVREDGSPWLVGVRDPFADDPDRAVLHIPLQGGLSSSAALTPGESTSDIIDPSKGEPLSATAACSVLAPSALDAEVLSTALVAMGKERACEYLGRKGVVCSVCWLERGAEGVLLDWMGVGHVR